MSYQVQNFKDGEPLNDYNLNNIEAGIVAVESQVNILKETLEQNGVSAGGLTVLSISTGDLNDYVDSGFYSISSDDASVQNMPVSGWKRGILFVCKAFEHSQVTQIYFTVEGTLIYGRYLREGGWKNWCQIGGEILQTAGTSETRLMSQKAITSAISSQSSSGGGAGGGAGGMTSNDIDRRNTLLNLKQIIDLQYTLLNDLPKKGSDTPWSEGTQLTGLPYSDVFMTDKYLCFDVSLDTFMSAINNPRSDLYLKTTDTSWTKPIYGTACSVFVSYCFGFDAPYSTAEYAKDPNFVEVRPDQIQPCDVMLLNTSDGFGHIRIVEDVKYDEFHFPTEIVVCEAVSPLTKRGTYTYDWLTGQISKGYKILRYTKLWDVPYTPLKYNPQMNESESVIVYSDICASTGDKATIKAGEDVTLNILNSEGYTSVVVTKDGETFGEYGVLEDISLTNLTGGVYEAKMYPENDHSSTKFIVCDVSATKDGNKVSFTFTNCTPLSICGTSANGGVYERFKVSEAEAAQGYKEVVFTDSRVKQTEVVFSNEYGNVAVYAE